MATVATVESVDMEHLWMTRTGKMNTNKNGNSSLQTTKPGRQEDVSACWNSMRGLEWTGQHDPADENPGTQNTNFKTGFGFQNRCNQLFTASTIPKPSLRLEIIGS